MVNRPVVLEQRNTILRIPGHLARALEQDAVERYPEECCGALLGSARVVVQIRPTQNVSPGPKSQQFEIDPRDLLAVHQEARQRGLEVLGYYHSHPDSPARPSTRDFEVALPDVSYLIVAVRGGRVLEQRCWRLSGDRHRFVEERLVRGRSDDADIEHG